MSKVYQSRVLSATQDHDTAEQAALAVEAAGQGSVVEFLLEPNRPGCLPKFVHKSLGLWTLEDGKWLARAIFSGSATPLGEERPGSNAIELRRLAATPFIAEVLTPYGAWNEMGRYRSAKMAEKANVKSLKHIPNATLRVRDVRVSA